MTNKEIIIDGIKYFRQSDINKGLDEEHYVTEFHLLATHYNLLLEDYARKYNSLQEQLKHKEQECEKLKNKNQYLTNTYCHFKNEIKKYKKAVHKYKVVLQDKIERLHLSRREFLEEINSISKRIACNNEDFKNALNNFNNAIQVINNEDRYKQALDEIGKLIPKFESSRCDYGDFDCENCSDLDEDIVCAYKLKKVIKGIISKAKRVDK